MLHLWMLTLLLSLVSFLLLPQRNLERLLDNFIDLNFMIIIFGLVMNFFCFMFVKGKGVDVGSYILVLTLEAGCNRDKSWVPNIK
ncbi:hypothetical protein Hanom_Chr17g01554891 [Helianthus anomalus]